MHVSFHRCHDDLAVAFIGFDERRFFEISATEVSLLETGEIEVGATKVGVGEKRLLEAAGTKGYVEIVRRFELREYGSTLLTLAVDAAKLDTRVAAADQLLRFGEGQRMSAVLTGAEPEAATRLLQALGYVGRNEANDCIEAIMLNAELDRGRRISAVEALGRHRSGERRLLSAVEKQQLLADLSFASANVLLSSRDRSIRQRASKHVKQ